MSSSRTPNPSGALRAFGILSTAMLLVVGTLATADASRRGTKPNSKAGRGVFARQNPGGKPKVVTAIATAGGVFHRTTHRTKDTRTLAQRARVKLAPIPAGVAELNFSIDRSFGRHTYKEVHAAVADGWVRKRLWKPSKAERIVVATAVVRAAYLQDAEPISIPETYLGASNEIYQKAIIRRTERYFDELTPT